MKEYTLPLVTIITPCYNSKSYVRDTIESVLQQTYKELEYIIIDDGSNDGSWEIIKSYGSKIQSFQTENLGACHARNLGYKKAIGDYLLFLDSDDIISKDMIKELVEFSCKHPLSIVASPWTRIKKNGAEWVETNSGIKKLPPKNDPILGWISGWYYPPCSILWPKKVYSELDGWDESLHANQDGDIMLRALLHGTNFMISDRGKSFYRIHDDSRMSISKDIISNKALVSRMRVLNKVIIKLIDLDHLHIYREAIGIAYHKLARNNILQNNKLANGCLKLSKKYSNGRIVGTISHRVITTIIGLENKEKIAHFFYKIGLGNTKRKLFNKIKKYE
jgi:O-antigen biosynthesis protein